MKRYAVFFELKPGKKEAYKKRHEEIWPEMSALLTLAGYQNYSIWNVNDMLFAYYEMEDVQKAEEVCAGSVIWDKWRAQMEQYVFVDEKGQKEWPMDLMFLHE